MSTGRKIQTGGIVYFGKTALGQIVYDLGISDLTDRYLARKHHMKIADLRSLRARLRKTIRGKKKRSRK